MAIALPRGYSRNNLTNTEGIFDERGNLVGLTGAKDDEDYLVKAYSDPVTGAVSLSAGGTPMNVSRVIGQSAIPVILAPNGTVATNGTITLGTALPTIYANAWVRLPAGAVVGGLAGLYFATFSSTTVGVITTTFVDAATAFTPYIPASPTTAVGSNSAYTQTTAADITLANVTVPGGLMGANGALRPSVNFTYLNNANTKTIKSSFGSLSVISAAVSTTWTFITQRILRNRGSLASQATHFVGAIDSGAINAVNSYGNVNTAIDQPLTFTGQLAVATDYLVLEGFTVEVLPA